MEKTKIKLFAHFSNKENFIYDKETYIYSVLFITVSGSFQYRINNSAAAVAKAGEAVYCPPGSTFHRKVISPVDMYMIKFEGTLPRGVYTINSRIKDDLAALSPKTFIRKPEEDPVAAHYCKDILFTLLSLKGAHSADPILKHINEHISERLKNDDLCRIMHCSEVSLISNFKSLTGKTPQQYINEKRIELAKEILLSSDISVSQVSASCGFEDPLYFSKVFKKYTANTPTQFKNKYKL